MRRLGETIKVGTLGRHMVIPSIDFETYSEAGFIRIPAASTRDSSRWLPPFKIAGVGSQGIGGLPVIGTPAYAEHPTTEVLSLCYDLKDGRGVQLWLPAGPSPSPLLNYVANGGTIEAHNVAFEWYIWNLVCTRRYGWPNLPLSQCRCSKAKAKAFSLPGALDALAKVLGTAQKDKAGHTLLRRLSVPQTPTKSRGESRLTPAIAWDDFKALYSYNAQDIIAEDAASAAIPDLTPTELEVWQTDQKINARGVQVDIEALNRAFRILDHALVKYNDELKRVTQGAVETVNQNKRFIDWVSSQGISTSSLDESARKELLTLELPPKVRRAIEIAELIMSANVKKLKALKLQVSSDGRLRDQYVYCGADRTGRWAAGGVQLQNLTAKGPRTSQCESCNQIFGRNDTCPRCGSWLLHDLSDWGIDAVEQAINDIKSGASLCDIEKIWGSPVAVLTGCLRGLFTAKKGYKLICCDFSAIEAVAAACLSRCKWRIEVFSTPNECIYTRSAASITGTPLEFYKEYREKTGAHHKDRKNIGKIAELASGYGGWVPAWKAFGADMSDDEIKASILAWREASPEIVEMWGGQYRWCGPGKWEYRPEFFGLEGAAIQAVLNVGRSFSHNDITYGVADDILYCRLPSGRYLHYHRPRVHETTDKLNRGPSLQLTFEGYNSNSQKGKAGWGRLETFGGRLFENVVQAVSRDIQAEALVRLERYGYSVVMHTHDEACAEVPDDKIYNVKNMTALMVQRPAWASWWPIKADGWEGFRYRKD